MTRSYLAAILTPDRLAEISPPVADDAPVNADFNPHPLLLPPALVDEPVPGPFRADGGHLAGVAVGVYLLRLRPVSLAIFTAGFAASALEVVLLAGFQILCGSVYRQVG